MKPSIAFGDDKEGVVVVDKLRWHDVVVVKVSGDEIPDERSVCSIRRSGVDWKVPPMIITVADEALGGEGGVGRCLVACHYKRLDSV